jgi:hypothetical protein
MGTFCLFWPYTRHDPLYMIKSVISSHQRCICGALTPVVRSLVVGLLDLSLGLMRRTSLVLLFSNRSSDHGLYSAAFCGDDPSLPSDTPVTVCCCAASLHSAFSYSGVVLFRALVRMTVTGRTGIMEGAGSSADMVSMLPLCHCDRPISAL